MTNDFFPNNDFESWKLEPPGFFFVFLVGYFLIQDYIVKQNY